MFESKGLKLSGIVNIPDGIKPGERRPACIVLHGFGSTKNAANVLTPCTMLNRLGYITMRFDFPGCGDSEGERGLLLCPDQVVAAQDALTLLQDVYVVDSARVAVIGSSFGAAVAVYATATDQRFAACISASGWGNGALKFEAQHNAPGAFDKFMRMLADGREHKARTGKSMMVNRYDIVPIPESLRTHVVAKSIIEMPVETAQSMYDFRAEEVVDRIAPRPVLFLHSAVDSVTPPDQTVRMFQRAEAPAELHMFSGTDHFMFAESNKRVHEVVSAWLREFFPI
ncbi:MAG TPA: alpha/beta hydrolase [Stellaceae bacterium]|nr:alpha/beta hydrolase [Stellaceae bacterium]